LEHKLDQLAVEIENIQVFHVEGED
jgi:hypothetical protein